MWKFSISLFPENISWLVPINLKMDRWCSHIFKHILINERKYSHSLTYSWNCFLYSVLADFFFPKCHIMKNDAITTNNSFLLKSSRSVQSVPEKLGKLKICMNNFNIFGQFFSLLTVVIGKLSSFFQRNLILQCQEFHQLYHLDN